MDLGFQKSVCWECRGEKPIAAPKASIPGFTSKIKRYYWREIFFETARKLHEAYPDKDPSLCVDYLSLVDERKPIEKKVVEELKTLHDRSPKYHYSEIPQSKIISQTNTEVILVNAEHSKGEKRKVGIRCEGKIISVEKFASIYFKEKGFKVIETESAPFHALFCVFMGTVIQDTEDPKIRIVTFGDRFDFEEKSGSSKQITTILPEDFGSRGYYLRRKAQILKHLDGLNDIDQAFRLWLDASTELRQYLWAHHESYISKAKKILSIISSDVLVKVLKYMVIDFWKNFCGWPDLIVFNESTQFFVEVKSTNDKLSEDQKNWLLGNQKYMEFKVKIFKVGKK